MLFFLDTANLKEIEDAASLGIMDGVTTNPSLMAKVGITGKDQIFAHYKRICEIVDGDVSAEVISTDYEGMIQEGLELAEIDERIVVKIPMTRDGLRAISYLTSKNIRTNCTLIFSATQGLMAAKAGATYVSPFLGRLDDISSNGLYLIEDLATIFDNYGIETKILAASIRHPMHVVECAKIGADVMTAPYSVYLSLLQHPLTDIGLEKFIQDSQKLSM